MNNRIHGIIIGQVMKIHPKADVRLVNDIVRIALREVVLEETSKLGGDAPIEAPQMPNASRTNPIPSHINVVADTPVWGSQPGSIAHISALSECIFCGPDHPEGVVHSDAEIRAYERGRAAARDEGRPSEKELARAIRDCYAMFSHWDQKEPEEQAAALVRRLDEVAGLNASEPPRTEWRDPGVLAREASAEGSPHAEPFRRGDASESPPICDAPLTDFMIDAGTCQRPLGHSGIHWFRGDASESGQPPEASDDPATYGDISYERQGTRPILLIEDAWMVLGKEAMVPDGTSKSCRWCRVFEGLDHARDCPVTVAKRYTGGEPR